MNYSTAVFLINDKVRAMACTYEAQENASRTIFKTMDPAIKVGDFCIVPTDTRHKMTVVKVVDADVDPDLDSTAPMAWIVAPVELDDYAAILKKEEQAIETIKSAEKTKRRAEMRDAVFKDQQEKLSSLQLTDLATASKPITPLS